MTDLEKAREEAPKLGGFRNLPKEDREYFRDLLKKEILRIAGQNPNGIRTTKIARQLFPPNRDHRQNRTYSLISKLRKERKIKPKPPGTGSPWVLK